MRLRFEHRLQERRQGTWNGALLNDIAIEGIGVAMPIVDYRIDGRADGIIWIGVVLANGIGLVVGVVSRFQLVFH